MKKYRPDRCQACGKFRFDPIHDPGPRPPSLLQRILHLAWPSWIHAKHDHHLFQTDAPLLEALFQAEQLKRLTARLKRRKRT